MEGPSPRIVKETKTIQTDPVPGITFQPDPNNYKHFFIELIGTLLLIQALPAHATKEENSEQNYCSLMITPCRLQKLSSTPRSTTLTSVLFLSPRQFRKNLPRYPQEKLVACASDEVCLALHSKSLGRAQPRRSP